jgi:hypothetical protein
MVNKVFLYGTYNVHMRTPRKHLRKKVALKIQQLLPVLLAGNLEFFLDCLPCCICYGLRKRLNCVTCMKAAMSARACFDVSQVRFFTLKKHKSTE